MNESFAADIDIKNIYLKFINKSKIEYNQLVRKVDRIYKSKQDCYKCLIARKENIANNLCINLDDYNIEFINQVYNPELALENKVMKLLHNNNEETGDRRDIIQLAKWCSILRNEDSTFNRLRICKKKCALSYSEYRQYLFDFYSKVHKALLNGDAYRFTHGIGTIYFKRFELSDEHKLVDFAATRKRKQEIIDAGKIPYNKIDAINAEYNGIKYDGVPYTIYRQDKYGYVLRIRNSRFFKSFASCQIKPVKYINAKYRNYTYEDLIEKFCRSEDDVSDLQIDVRTKLSILLIMNPGISLRFQREYGY